MISQTLVSDRSSSANSSGMRVRVAPPDIPIASARCIARVCPGITVNSGVIHSGMPDGIRITLWLSASASGLLVTTRRSALRSFSCASRLTNRESVLPSAVTARLAVEMGVSLGWHKWVGLHGAVMALDHYGASAPAARIIKEFGFTVERVVEQALAVAGRR